MLRFSPDKKDFVFGTFHDLKQLLDLLNTKKGLHYELVQQDHNIWLIEEDLGDDYLNYAMVEVRGDTVYAISDDVRYFLERLRDGSGTHTSN